MVYARCTCHEQTVTSVTLRNVPSFVEALDVEIDVPNLGLLSIDLVYGGDFFALVDAAQIEVELTPENAYQLVELGESISAQPFLAAFRTRSPLPDVQPSFRKFRDVLIWQVITRIFWTLMIHSGRLFAHRHGLSTVLTGVPVSTWKNGVEERVRVTSSKEERDQSAFPRKNGAQSDFPTIRS